MKASILLVGNFLSSKGINPSVGEQLADRLKRTGLPVITTSNKSSRLFRLIDMVLTTWKRRREYQVAYVEIYSGSAFIWAEVVCIILKLAQKPYVLAMHGGNLPSFASRWPGRVSRLLNSANVVTAPSRYLLENMRFYRGDILLLPNPIALDTYSFCPRLEPAPRLVWLRAFHSIYNPQMVPHVIERLRKVSPAIVLTMVGPDKGDGSLQETKDAIQKIGLEGNIKIIPGISKNKVPETLAQADIFINSTNIDNMPVSLLEAMACGLCIVSTNVGGIPYFLEDGVDSLLVPPGDPDAMAMAVHRMLTEPGLAVHLSRNGRNKVEQFDWSVIVPRWENLFQQMIQG